VAAGLAQSQMHRAAASQRVAAARMATASRADSLPSPERMAPTELRHVASAGHMTPQVRLCETQVLGSTPNTATAICAGRALKSHVRAFHTRSTCSLHCGAWPRRGRHAHRRHQRSSVQPWVRSARPITGSTSWEAGRVLACCMHERSCEHHASLGPDRRCWHRRRRDADRWYRR
jgi:hypothetical protein